MKRILLPELETERLLLKKISFKDIDDIFEYAVNPLVGPNAGWKPHVTKKDTEEFIKYALKKREYGQPGVYSIYYKDNEKMIGTIEIHSYKEYKAEIGFVLNPEYWNQGIITEASKAVIIYAFEVLNISRLTYGYFLFNARSKRVCDKLEFTFEGILRNKFKNYDDEIIDEAVSSITKEDYFNNKLSWVNEFKQALKVDYEGI